MTKEKTKKEQIRTLVLSAVFAAIVFVLQLLGAFIRFGPFAISLVLVPIVIGTALCGVKTGAFLGLVFSVAVLISGDATAFMQISVFGTVVTVLLKGMLAGLAAGLVYKALEKFNRYFAVIAAAIVCPLVNTGVFVLGCFTFFYKALGEWAPSGQGTVAYIFLVLVGGNFLFEILSNLILSPVILRVLNIEKKNM